MNYYLSTNAVISAYKQLIALDVQNASILHIFFILKACGFNDVTFKSVDLIPELGLEMASRISLLFSPFELKPERYDFINPFEMNEWKSQSPSEPLRNWVRGRVKNNILGGATTWRLLVTSDKNSENLKFTYNYIEEIQRLTLGSSKLSLFALAIWSNRFIEFETEASLSELVSEFISTFHLSNDEISSLFHTQIGGLEISYSESMHNPQKIRNLIGNPSSVPEWQQSNLLDNKNILEADIFKGVHMNDFSVEKISTESVYQDLLDYNQVILFGPPGTSKSFLASQIASKFDETKKIQFHPKYSYQDFVGGYIVDKTEVVYQKGVLLELLDDVLVNPDKKYLLIIDEINRANVSQVFGEMTQCLDRDFETELKVNGLTTNLSLPRNLYIIATMNSSDRSIGSLDHAIRRRFLSIYCPPNLDLLLELCSSDTSISLRDFLARININLYKELKNRELVIGHSIFFNENFKQDGYFVWSMSKIERLFNSRILPIIEEYCYGDENKVQDICGVKLASRLSGKDFEEALIEFTMVVS